ncbi:MAG: hypothetical protein ACRC6N_11240 [Plesiomonas sp.]|uniref:hypothetical protein n=1 Tax=Plesiomonas sp. TaxID=2486279 RepID=UPI003F398A76
MNVLSSKTIISSRSPYIKSNGQISGYGLKLIIDHLPNILLSRSARQILSIVSSVASSTSEYKIYKSKKNLALECGTSIATVRRNLDKAVNAKILTKSYIFDDKHGQKATEYQFTPRFLLIAVDCINAVKSIAKSDIKMLIKHVATAFTKAFNLLPTAKSPCQNDLPSPDQSDLQDKVMPLDQELKKTIPTPQENITSTTKQYQTAKAERAKTRAADRSERENIKYAERLVKKTAIQNAAKKLAYYMAKKQNYTTSPHAFRAREDHAAEKAREVTKHKIESAVACGFDPKSTVRSIMAAHFGRKYHN